MSLCKNIYCDSTTQKNANCAAQENNSDYFCSRPKEHTGAHRACCSYEHNLKTWTDKKSKGPMHGKHKYYLLLGAKQP